MTSQTPSTPTTTPLQIETAPPSAQPNASPPKRPPLNFPVDSYDPPMLNREALYGDSER